MDVQRATISSSPGELLAAPMTTDHRVSGSKKRKHGEADLVNLNPKGRQEATFAVSNDNARNGLRPLVAATPSLALSNEVELTLYEATASTSGSRDGKKDKGKGRAASSMLHGDSAKLEWTSANHLAPEPVPWRPTQLESDASQNGQLANAEEASASYALALYDPSTSTVSLIETPLHILQHIPKRLKNLPSISSRDPGTNNALARSELGMTFGTKKSQKAIKAAERNRVDAGAQDLQVLQDVMQQGLEEGLETLPESSQVVGKPVADGAEASAARTSAAVASAAATGRPVPDPTASKPEDVYEIFGSVILEKEYKGIQDTLSQLQSDNKAKAISLLPYRHSTWVNDRVKDVVQNRDNKYKDSDRKRRLRRLIWISALMALKTRKGSLDPYNADGLAKFFSQLVSFETAQSLVERFTESVRGTKQRSMTPASEVRLMSHLLVVCLSAENFGALEFQTLANDLQYQQKRMTELLKMLGCRIVIPRGKDLERLTAEWRVDGKTIPEADQGRLKVAVLSIPLEFPSEKKSKGPAKR